MTQPFPRLEGIQCILTTYCVTGARLTMVVCDRLILIPTYK